MKLSFSPPAPGRVRDSNDFSYEGGQQAGPAKERYHKLSSVREPYLQRARDAARLTIREVLAYE